VLIFFFSKRTVGDEHTEALSSARHGRKPRRPQATEPMPSVEYEALRTFRRRTPRAREEEGTFAGPRPSAVTFSSRRSNTHSLSVSRGVGWASILYLVRAWRSAAGDRLLRTRSMMERQGQVTANFQPAILGWIRRSLDHSLRTLDHEERD
jgi:hypothetical protein